MDKNCVNCANYEMCQKVYNDAAATLEPDNFARLSGRDNVIKTSESNNQDGECKYFNER